MADRALQGSQEEGTSGGSYSAQVRGEMDGWV